MVRTLEERRKLVEVRDDAREPSDEDLLLRYRDNGDQGAFDQLVHRFERELYSYLRRYLGNASLAEDVFQATFLQVHLKRNLFDKGRRFRPWLYTIATHQAIDALRRGGRHQSISIDANMPENGDLGALIGLLSDSEPAPDSHLESEEIRVRMRRCLDELPEHLRGVVVLIYYQGMKYRDAAEILHIPVGTVKSRLHAAMLKLSETWKRQQPNED